jgi:hypothetical protein
MKVLVTMVIALLLPMKNFEQKENFWQVLAEVSFRHNKDAQGYDFEVPVFSKNLKSFQGKKIILKGYIIPLEEMGGGGKFMLSSLPFNVCYFCGAAGPETVVEVDTDMKIKFTTKQIMMEGILALNESDPNHHIYILKSVKLLTP